VSATTLTPAAWHALIIDEKAARLPSRPAMLYETGW
jgi:hypothetical protein